MICLKKIKLIAKIFLIIGLVFSISAIDSNIKKKQMAGSSTTVGKDVTARMPFSKRKIAIRWDRDGRKIGFRLKDNNNFTMPNIVLTNYTKKSGKGDSPNGTYEGTESCEYGGTITLKNYQISNFVEEQEVQHGITMDTVEYNVKGNVIYKDCEDEATDYFDDDGTPDLYEEVSNGTMTISGTQEVGFDVGGGGKGETNISEIRVQAKKFRYNDDVFDMDITTHTDLYEEELDPLSDGKGGFYIDVTLDGIVQVTGTINGEPVEESHTYNKQTVRNHFLNCNIKKPKTWKKCESITE